MKPKFSLGHVVMTLGIADWINTAVEPVQQYVKTVDHLHRHVCGDWGEVCAEDKEANDSALIHGNRLLSAYTVDDRKLWIITEADRSSTTVMFPEEY